MKKIIAVLLSLMVMMSVCSVAAADEGFSNVTYYMEYNEDGTATLIFQAGSLGAFDFGVIYDANSVTVKEYDYSEKFYEISTDENNTAIYVKNDKAVDNVGNSTYVVFTGALMDAEDGSSVNFAENDVAYITFSDISEGDEVAVVMETAQVQDVKNAQLVGAVDLYQQIEIGTSSLLDGAEAEPEKEDPSSEEKNTTWIYGVVFGVIIVAGVVLVLVSKKNKLDVNVKQISEEDDEE